MSDWDVVEIKQTETDNGTIYNYMTTCIYFKIKDVHHHVLGKWGTPMCLFQLNMPIPPMSVSMLPVAHQMASFISNKMAGECRYMRDFKYPHNQKSASFNPGDLDEHSNLQSRLIIRSSGKMTNRNTLNSREKWSGTQSCTK